jgi:hypothetical protein
MAMLRPITFILLVTTAGTLESQLTPEQRTAREPAVGAPIWAPPGGDLSTHLTAWDYHIRALRAEQVQRATPELRRPDAGFGPAIATREHWMAITPEGSTAAPARRTADRTFPLPAGYPTTLTLSPRRAAPGTVAMVALRIDNADGTRHWSVTQTSVVDASRHHTLTLPGLPRGTYTLTIEVFNPEDPDMPESRSVNQLHVD